jgi:raffinose/stachyose/melibiose transport system permease protein
MNRSLSSQLIMSLQTLAKVLALAFFFIFMAFPLIWLFYSAFKPMQEIYDNVFALPKKVDFTNILHIWGSRSFPRYYVNSVFVTSTSTAGIVLLASLAGFIFGRVRFRGREMLFMFLIAGMMIPVQVTLIPNFVLLRTLDLFDTYLAMILPYIAFNVPVSVFIMRGFFQDLPAELEDAAAIDGCNLKRIFFNIMMPLSVPALSTILIFNFFTVWNELIFALTFTNRQEVRTIPVGIMDFVGQFETDYGYIFAALASASIPLLIVYFFSQKKIIKGLTAGAIKG